MKKEPIDESVEPGKNPSPGDIEAAAYREARNEALTQASIAALAKHLAANYANVSLSRVNPKRGQESSHKHAFNHVFGTGHAMDPEFTRTICVVGANVSQASFPELFRDGVGTIEEVEKALGLKVRWEEPHFRELYGLHANTYLRRSFNIESDLEIVKRELRMEGRLSVLEKLYSPWTVRRTLNELVYHRHFPSPTYELLAHMFKHRLIDVIINLNFDELLDNAIEDEIGGGELKKVTPENVHERSDELFTHHRLRYPIYIKPHGTASQFSSLAYTDEHYVGMNSNMRKLLFDVFRGYTGSDDARDRTGQVNVMALGYGYNDLDMQRVLFDSIKEHGDGRYNMFFWSRKPIARFNQLARKFGEYWVDLVPSEPSDARKKQAELRWPTIEDYSALAPSMGQKVTLHPLYFIEKIHPTKYDVDLAAVYKEANRLLNEPFKIGDPLRHELLTALIPKEVVNGVHSSLVVGAGGIVNRTKLKKYYALRTKFHMAYDFFKHAGCMPYSVFQGERAAKYYEAYLDQFTSEDRYGADSMQVLAAAMIPKFAYHPDWCGYGNKRTLPRNGRAKIAAKASAHLVRLAKKLDGSSLGEGRVDYWNEVLDELSTKFENMSEHRHFEITPKLYDPKYGRFKAYDPAQVIFTNLQLTYQFYWMFKRMADHPQEQPVWDTLLLSSDTARALYNLYYHADEKEDYLRLINREDFTILMVAEDCPVPTSVEDGPKKDKTSEKKTMFEALKVERLPNATKDFLEPKVGVEHQHHMALFMKGYEPKFGLYVFKPSTRNRINPVYFDDTGSFDTEVHRDLRDRMSNAVSETKREAAGRKLRVVQTSTLDNLTIMRNLFKHEFTNAGGIWNKYFPNDKD